MAPKKTQTKKKKRLSMTSLRQKLKQLRMRYASSIVSFPVPVPGFL